MGLGISNMAACGLCCGEIKACWLNQCVSVYICHCMHFGSDI